MCVVSGDGSGEEGMAKGPVQQKGYKVLFLFLLLDVGFMGQAVFLGSPYKLPTPWMTRVEKSQRQHSAPHSGEQGDEEVVVSGSTGGTGG